MVAGLLMAGCHTSPARQHAIEQGVDVVNRERRAAAIGRVVAARGATLLDAKLQWLHWEEDIQWCRPELLGLPGAPPVHDVALKSLEGHLSIAVDCHALREATFRHRAFEGKTAEGRPVLVVPDRVDDEDVEPTAVAAAPGGKVLVLEPRNHAVKVWEIRLPRECNRMPGDRPPPRLAGVTAAYHVVEGRRLSDLERVPVTYDGEAVSTKCDSYVE
jgi:hypothetical protein